MHVCLFAVQSKYGVKARDGVSGGNSLVVVRMKLRWMDGSYGGFCDDCNKWSRKKGQGGQLEGRIFRVHGLAGGEGGQLIIGYNANV